jgi:hypothetical protein
VSRQQARFGYFTILKEAVKALQFGFTGEQVGKTLAGPRQQSSHDQFKAGQQPLVIEIIIGQFLWADCTHNASFFR